MYACEEMNILPQSSNAHKGCHKLFLESTARSSENPEGMRSAHWPLQYKDFLNQLLSRVKWRAVLPWGSGDQIRLSTKDFCESARLLWKFEQAVPQIKISILPLSTFVVSDFPKSPFSEAIYLGLREYVAIYINFITHPYNSAETVLMCRGLGRC